MPSQTLQYSPGAQAGKGFGTHEGFETTDAHRCTQIRQRDLPLRHREHRGSTEKKDKTEATPRCTQIRERRKVEGGRPEGKAGPGREAWRGCGFCPSTPLGVISLLGNHGLCPSTAHPPSPWLQRAGRSACPTEAGCGFCVSCGFCPSTSSLRRAPIASGLAQGLRFASTGRNTRSRCRDADFADSAYYAYFAEVAWGVEGVFRGHLEKNVRRIRKIRRILRQAYGKSAMDEVPGHGLVSRNAGELLAKEKTSVLRRARLRQACSG